MPKPVIFLACANAPVNNPLYLRSLLKEFNDIRKALQPAKKAGLCKITAQFGVTAKTIFNTFRAYKDRIAIFHYGGHSNSYQLLLGSQDGGQRAANIAGLVPFFAGQKGLKLIFW